jgi:membrane protein implicated in regulation of membrane protease activity
VSTNADLDIGESAVVIEEINENTGSGRVTLKGVDWSAVPAVSGSIIPKGSIVTVKKVQGAKLTVELKA